MNNLLLFGGAFDPIHYGHLNTAVNIQNKFHFDQFAFLPCKIPVLKKQDLITLPQHRLAMLKLALSELKKQDHFYIDTHEITRNSPSYTVTTLQAFRHECGKNRPITLLLGWDAFCQLPTWYEWEQLIKLTNLLIIKRAGYQKEKISNQVQTLLLAHETTNQNALLNTSHGLILCFNAGNYDISSTKIRESFKQKSIPKDSLPESVLHYIIEHKLYCLK